MKTTLLHLGFLGFIKQYFLTIFPIFNSDKDFLEIGGYLLCRGAKSTNIQKSPIDPVFGHWLGEQLPQIRGIEGVCQKLNKKCPLIIDKHPKNWQIESLEMMGYKKSELYNYNQKGLRVGTIIISSLRNVHSKETEFDPRARRWAAKRLQYNIEKLNLNFKHYPNICLFRQNEKTRKLSNYNDLKKLLDNYKYHEVKIEGLNY